MATDQVVEWRQALERISREISGRVVGLEKVEHFWHAKLVATAMRAFGADDRARFYVEVLPPKGRVPRPDLIVCHPQVGCMVIENKGLALTGIEGVDGTTLLLRRNHRLKREDPFVQAEKVEFRLKDLLAHRLKRGRPLFTSAVALPAISRSEFIGRFSQEWPAHTLFEDAFASPEMFRQQVLSIVARATERARRKVVWHANGAEELHRVIKGTTFIAGPRPSRLEDVGADNRLPTGEEPLGLRIERASLADNLPTAQQHEIGRRDFRGAHWLFRGVAGSGKSVMLALSAARSLYESVLDQEDVPPEGPPSRVLVCCFNKSLVHFLRGRIEERFGRLAYEAPPDGSLVVTHFEGLIKRLEKAEPALVTGLSFKQADERATRLAAAFDALAPANQRRLQFDAVYLDEAQDLRHEEIRLLRRLARPDTEGRQTLVIFYDNAQNIYGTPLPVWDELGVKIVGRTTYLDRCLRNTRQILELPFNVLVGSHAPEGERVMTRDFADLASLRQRGLIDEQGGRIDVKFALRADGSPPEIRLYPDRVAEAQGVVDYVRRLVHEQQVLPSDILLLAKSFKAYPDLEKRLQAALGPNFGVRMVDPDHKANKSLPLIEDGMLTASTIASAKGYDAAIAILMGCDQIDTTREGRALFYVGATRAKFHLILTAVDRVPPVQKRAGKAASLLPEIVATAAALGVVPAAPPAESLPPPSRRGTNEARGRSMSL